MAINYMLNGKAAIVLLTVELIKRHSINEWIYCRTRMKVELDLSNHATKADLKNAPGVDTSKFAKNVDLAYFKSNVAKLDSDKVKNVPTNLRNLKSKVQR